MPQALRVEFALNLLQTGDIVEIWEEMQEKPDRIGMVLRASEMPWLTWRGEEDGPHDIQLIGGLRDLGEGLPDEILPNLFTPGRITLGEGHGCCYAKVKRRGSTCLSRWGIVVQRLRVVRGGEEVQQLWAPLWKDPVAKAAPTP